MITKRQKLLASGSTLIGVGALFGAPITAVAATAVYLAYKIGECQPNSTSK
jgi:hypothetical protein